MNAITLSVIGLKAVEYQQAIAARKAARKVLIDAYAAWKEEQGVSRVERDTKEWELMLDDTASEFRTFADAKRRESNLAAQLQRACRKVVI